MFDQNSRLVQRALEEVFGAGNLSAVDEIFHEDFINHDAGPRTPPGPEGLKVTVGWLHQSFSDLHYEIEDEIAAGDKVVVRVVSSGRHTGPFIGFPATGRTFSVEQIHIYRIADGKIIEHWSSRDDLSQGMQLGFIPGPRPSVADRSSAGAATPTAPSSSADRAAEPLAKTAEIPVGAGLILAAARLVVTQPTPGTINAFDATCTHMGCTVAEVADGVIRCPCHGSEFSIEDGSVRRGPAGRPLPRHEIRIVGDEVSAV